MFIKIKLVGGEERIVSLLSVDYCTPIEDGITTFHFRDGTSADFVIQYDSLQKLLRTKELLID